MKIKYPVLKKTSVLFIERTEINWKTSDVDGLCTLFFLHKMRWLLGVIVKLHNDECLICIFTGNVENGTPIIFNKNNSSLYK